jgi:hypothetical protein
MREKREREDNYAGCEAAREERRSCARGEL